MGKADIGTEKRQDAEEDEAEGVRQTVHRCDKAGRIAMACHEIEEASHNNEHRSLNREIMTQPFHNGNANGREDGYPYDAQKKAAGHRLRIEGPHQVAIARHISTEHAIRNANDRVDDLHREGVDACLIKREKITAEQDSCLPRQVECHRHQTIAPGIGPHHRQDVPLGILLLMAIVLQQVIKMMHTQQIMLAERAHGKTAGKIGDAKAQDAEAEQQANDARR